MTQSTGFYTHPVPWEPGSIRPLTGCYSPADRVRTVPLPSLPGKDPHHTANAVVVRPASKSKGSRSAPFGLGAAQQANSRLLGGRSKSLQGLVYPNSGVELLSSAAGKVHPETSDPLPAAHFSWTWRLSAASRRGPRPTLTLGGITPWEITHEATNQEPAPCTKEDPCQISPPKKGDEAEALHVVAPEWMRSKRGTKPWIPGKPVPMLREDFSARWFAMLPLGFHQHEEALNFSQLTKLRGTHHDQANEDD